MRTTIRFLLENSAFLLIGAILALFWANTAPESYSHLLHLPLFENPWIGAIHHEALESAHGDPTRLAELYANYTGVREITLHFLINEILMALFFAIAGKEVWEATLPGGPLNNPRQAAAPLFATIGGMAGPAGIYLLGAMLLGEMDTYSNGWAIPCATDIAFSYMVARMVFGAGHPAIPFLLLLAIADDALGLVIIAAFYPQGPVTLIWLALPIGAMVICYCFKQLKIHSFWPYLVLAGSISWLGFHWANLHPALGLLPIIPMMPHAHADTGLFDWSKMETDDTLTRFEHWFKNPVEIILGLFGLLNAGVMFAAIGHVTWLVLAGLLIGKPLGIVLFGLIANKLGFKLPKGMGLRDLAVLGCAAAIGFTVAIFVSSVAFPAGPIQDAAKIGALGSFAAAILTFFLARVLGVKKVMAKEDPAEQID